MRAKLPFTVGLIEQIGLCVHGVYRLQRSPRRYNILPDQKASEGAITPLRSI